MLLVKATVPGVGVRPLTAPLPEEPLEELLPEELLEEPLEELLEEPPDELPEEPEAPDEASTPEEPPPQAARDSAETSSSKAAVQRKVTPDMIDPVERWWARTAAAQRTMVQARKVFLCGADLHQQIQRREL